MIPMMLPKVTNSSFPSLYDTLFLNSLFDTGFPSLSVIPLLFLPFSHGLGSTAHDTCYICTIKWNRISSNVIFSFDIGIRRNNGLILLRIMHGFITHFRSCRQCRTPSIIFIQIIYRLNTFSLWFGYCYWRSYFPDFRSFPFSTSAE